MKYVKIMMPVLSFFLLIYTPFTVHAEIVDSLLEEARTIETSEGYRVADTAENVLSGEFSFSFSDVLMWLKRALFSELKQNQSLLLSMTATCIFIGVLSALSDGKNRVHMFVCGVFIARLSLGTFTVAKQIYTETADELFLFTQALLPTVATALTASGRVATATHVGTVFTAMQVFMHICTQILLPLVVISVVLSVADRLGAKQYIKGITAFLKQAIKHITGLLLIFYGAVLGIGIGAAGATDTLTGKTVKYMIGSFVPVVGSALSDSAELVAQSGKAVKHALGIGGMLGILYVAAVPVIRLCALMLAYKLAGLVCSIGGTERESGIVQEIGGGIAKICGLTVSVCVMFFISIAMLCMMGGM